MTEDEERLLRDYAAMRTDWAALRYQGYDYHWVLAGLGALGLRPPVFLEGGPNAEALARGRSLFREAIAQGAG